MRILQHEEKQVVRRQRIPVAMSLSCFNLQQTKIKHIQDHSSMVSSIA